MAEFHFLRPLWLLTLPVVPVLAWTLWRRLHAGERWRRICDPHLLPHLLTSPDEGRRAWPLAALALGATLAVLALAGPTWERLEQPAYRTLNARVVVLDLSRSMDAGDLKPSRLVRARFKVVDVLRRSRDRPVGLVVFAGDAFLVSPLTQDANTLVSLLPAVDTSVMPVQGSRADLGLEAAGELMDRGGARRGDVVLVTDGVKGSRAEDVAADLRDKGIRVFVLAAGTPEGAPIPAAGGAYLKDLAGEIVIARTDYEALRAIARAGGGRFAAIASDDRDIDALLGPTGAEDWRLEVEAVKRTASAWRERGPWLVLALMPLAAIGFRRGWLLGIPLIVSLSLPEPAAALTWADLWARPDQQAARALEEGDAERAAALAPGPAWRGSALYRGGRYPEAAAAFGEGEGAVAHYNRGNALARSGRLRRAIEAYDAALAEDPGFADAAYNRAVVERLLENLRQQASSGADAGRAGEQQAQDLSGPGSSDSAADDDGAVGAGSGGVETGPDGERQDSRATRDRSAASGTRSPSDTRLTSEEQQAIEQWLRRVPDDPGGLLRRKFQLEYRRRHGEREQMTDAW